jgi:hypothetical protein
MGPGMQPAHQHGAGSSQGVGCCTQGVIARGGVHLAEEPHLGMKPHQIGCCICGELGGGGCIINHSS